jgi:ABC-type multidrug transport system ATPase subunit
MEQKLLEDELSIFSPANQIDLHWREVSVSIKGKPILKNLNGVAQSACLNAIMGASGAGKTTFLNYLSCRLTKTKNNTLGGQVFANNMPCTSELLSKTAAYVMQDDILMDTLTPRG